jgi:8-oxo-dGTP pyrophosphatase MutT (NUDIX family)
MPPLLSLDHITAALTTRPPRPLPEGSARRAAVAAVFRDGDHGAELLFIQRASQPHDPWSGQVAFPGGREEDGDPDLVATAVRETDEELGLDLRAAGVPLGALDPMQARSRTKITPLTVHPYAWALRGPVPAFHRVPNAEVASAFWVRLRDLADRGRHFEYDAMRAEIPYTFPAIDLGGNRVLWGLTHRMVVEMAGRLGLVDDVDAMTELRPR